ncbi:hypothetical protein ES708_21038 [subsurface metagenome]
MQERASEWNACLSEDWINHEDTSIYYINGHVQVYHGHNPGKKHISRQKLCLPGMMEFRVNNADGLPYFYVTGEVNEKLEEVITTRKNVKDKWDEEDFSPYDVDTEVETTIMRKGGRTQWR